MELCFTSIESIKQECEEILHIKNMINEYLYSTNPEYENLKKYVDGLSDENNPMLLLTEHLKTTLETLDTLFIIKQTKLFNLH